MARTISFNDLRNYFGGYNYKEGKSVGIHIEPGPDGGIVVLDDTLIFDKALKILGLTDYPEPELVDTDQAEQAE